MHQAIYDYLDRWGATERWTWTITRNRRDLIHSYSSSVLMFVICSEELQLNHISTPPKPNTGNNNVMWCARMPPPKPKSVVLIVLYWKAPYSATVPNFLVHIRACHNVDKPAKIVSTPSHQQKWQPFVVLSTNF